MPNIPYITDTDIEQQRVPGDLVAAIRARRSNGLLLNLDRMLLHSPPMARGWNTIWAQYAAISTFRRCFGNWLFAQWQN